MELNVHTLGEIVCSHLSARELGVLGQTCSFICACARHALSRWVRGVPKHDFLLLHAKTLMTDDKTSSWINFLVKNGLSTKDIERVTLCCISMSPLINISSLCIVGSVTQYAPISRAVLLKPDKIRSADKRLVTLIEKALCEVYSIGLSESETIDLVLSLVCRGYVYSLYTLAVLDASILTVISTQLLFVLPFVRPLDMYYGPINVGAEFVRFCMLSNNYKAVKKHAYLLALAVFRHSVDATHDEKVNWAGDLVDHLVLSSDRGIEVCLATGMTLFDIGCAALRCANRSMIMGVLTKATYKEFLPLAIQQPLTRYCPMRLLVEQYGFTHEHVSDAITYKNRTAISVFCRNGLTPELNPELTSRVFATRDWDFIQEWVVNWTLFTDEFYKIFFGAFNAWASAPSSPSPRKVITMLQRRGFDITYDEHCILRSVCMQDIQICRELGVRLLSFPAYAMFDRDTMTMFRHILKLRGPRLKKTKLGRQLAILSGNA